MTEIGRILIVGSHGQVGRELQRSFAGCGELLCYDRHNIDLADPSQVRTMVRDARAELILNAAAYTAVDRAETEQDLSMAVNATAPQILAEEAARTGVPFVHYSTDYIFDGTKREPWLETDSPNPLNAYGRTKLAGEQAVQRAGGRYLIFRTSWVYGPHGNNFLLTMLRLGKERDKLRIVNDQVGAPTTSIALADATRAAVDQVLATAGGPDPRKTGLFHMTCGGQTSWFGFAQRIFARAAERGLVKMPALEPIESSEYPTPATRPLYSVLSNGKLQEAFGISLPSWETALDRAIEQISG